MRVFLSYQSRDVDHAKRMAEALRRERPDIDLFLDAQVLTAGAYWVPRLAEELDKSDALLMLVGQRIGPWQELEYYEALRLSRVPARNGRPLIVSVIMEKQAPGLSFFEQLHHIFSPDPARPDTLAAVLAGLSGAAPADAGPAWRRFNPYKGLPALTSADAAFFFGREEVTSEILDALRPNPDTVLMLIGASGVGKSSVAQAGVLAALRSQLWPGGQRAWPAELADSRAWLTVTVRPGDAPLKELALSFVRLIVDKSYEQDGDAEGWVARFRAGARLADLLRIVRDELDQRAGTDALRRFVLYVDQAEELYARAPASDAQVFSGLVAEAARLPDFHVLASLRADYYGQLQADAALFPRVQRIDIPPLPADRLETVIRRPAERLGARFDSDDMPTQIAAATANEPGALPLLSYLMSDMWVDMQARDDGVLRWSERPEVIDIAAPLRERAERYRTANPAKENALRRLFTLRLAHIPREGEAVRRRARRSECGADEWEIAETLAGSDWRLLTLRAPDGGGEPTAEVAHEQLLRKWPSLSRWLEAQREFLVWKGEIESDRLEWEKLPEAERATGLLTGRRLTRAEQWLRSQGDDVPAADRAFVGASVEAAAESRVKAEHDQQRLKDAELQAALQRAETAKEREAAAQRIARRTVIGTFGVVGMGGVAGWAGYRAYESNEQSRLAQAQVAEADQRRRNAEASAKAELDRQLADLKGFWAQEGAAVSADAGSPEVTQNGPSGGGSNSGVATWGVRAVGAESTRYTGKGCVVALVGSGVDVSHPAFRGVTFIQKDFTGSGNGDEHGHDTHLAGTIFGRPVDNQRFGIAPGVTEVLVAKVLSKSGGAPKDSILRALQWVASHARRVDVICAALVENYAQQMSSRLAGDAVPGTARPINSWEVDPKVAQGLREYLQLLRTYQSFSVVAASLGKGAVVIGPAGNDSKNNVRVPVTAPLSVAQGVISVGSVEQGEGGHRIPWYSNAQPTLCAPGDKVLSAQPGGKFQSLTGTSMACAHAAGVAALWWEHLRSTNVGGEVTSRMIASAMLRGARTNVFAAGVQKIERGEGLVTAPPAS
jgi:subtilisin family serine protease